MTAFATLEDYVVAYPGSLTGGVTNEQAQKALDAACSQIRKYCAQLFDLVEDDEITVYGTGRSTLLLPELPVVAINSVTIDKTLDTELVVTDYRCDLESGLLFRSATSTSEWCWSSTWPAGFLNITVDYDHGYEEIPPDLVEVAVQLAHEKIVTTNPRLTGESIAGYSYSQTAGQPSLDDYKDVLEPYRNRRVPVA